MVGAICLAIYDNNNINNQNAINASPPGQLMWNIPHGSMPLDLQLDLEQRQNRVSPSKDSINVVDSVRWVEKVRWKTRYKNVADRTAAREVGMHTAAVTPDSMPNVPTITSTQAREEESCEVVGVSKAPSIQLTVDGKIVYSTNDNHSTEGGQ